MRAMIATVNLILFLLTIATKYASSIETCPSGWTTKSFGCYLNAEFNGTFNEAKAKCSSLHSKAILPMIFNTESRDQAYEMIGPVVFAENGNGVGIHINGKANATDEDWKMETTDNNHCSIGQLNFVSTEPTYGEEECLYLYKATNAYDKFVFDEPCDNVRNVVCQIPRSDPCVCPTNWTSLTYGCYYKPNVTKNYENAKSECRQLHSNAILATIFSNESQSEILKMMSTPSSNTAELICYINGKKNSKSGDWEIEDAQNETAIAPWIDWKSGKPTNLLHDECLVLTKMITGANSGKVRDISCTAAREFVCQIPVKNPRLMIAGGQGCPLNWKSGEYGCYFTSDKSYTYDLALAECKSLTKGSVLPTIVSASSRKEVYGFITNSTHINANDKNVDGVWLSEDWTGTQFYAPWLEWYPGEPSNSGGEERCGYMNTSDGVKQMFSGQCNESRPLVCYIPYENPVPMLNLDFGNEDGWMVGDHGLYYAEYQTAYGWNHMNASSRCRQIWPRATLPVLTNSHTRDEVWNLIQQKNTSVWINLQNINKIMLDDDHEDYTLRTVNSFGFSYRPDPQWAEWKEDAQPNLTGPAGDKCVILEKGDSAACGTRLISVANCNSTIVHMLICHIPFELSN